MTSDRTPQDRTDAPGSSTPRPAASRAGAAELELELPEFDGLLAAAREIAELAYAPYSRFHVGAAAIAEDGRMLRGCNVENAGYGVTLCAECGLVSDLIATGGGRLRRFVCVGGDTDLARDARPVVMPCGRCRQLLSEHAAPDLVILTPEGPRTMAEVLPQAFGPSDLRP